jgi:hypothetical protein
VIAIWQSQPRASGTISPIFHTTVKTQKLVDFLQDRIDINPDFLLPAIRAARGEHLGMIRRKAYQYAKSVDSQLPLAHQKRLSMLNEIAGDDETKKEPSMEKIAFFF